MSQGNTFVLESKSARVNGLSVRQVRRVAGAAQFGHQLAHRQTRQPQRREAWIVSPELSRELLAVFINENTCDVIWPVVSEVLLHSQMNDMRPFNVVRVHGRADPVQMLVLDRIL